MSCNYFSSSIFFIRNHLPVPVVDEEEYRLRIRGIGLEREVEVSLEELKTRFPRTSVTSALQCAGNRRSEMNEVKEVRGLSWEKGAIGNARWTGVRLVDLLGIVGARIGESTTHVQFEGLDLDASSSPYGASIPASRALDPNGDVLIAFEMNGEPLSLDHGFPVRVIAPGITGARNVKWLGSIILSGVESDTLWQQRDYKGFPPFVDPTNVDWSSAPAIQDYPVQSAICLPQQNSTLLIKHPDDCITIKGYAFSGGGRKITRVDVSIDGGINWHPSELQHDPEGGEKNNLYNTWSWALWEVYLFFYIFFGFVFFVFSFLLISLLPTILLLPFFPSHSFFRNNEERDMKSCRMSVMSFSSHSFFKWRKERFLLLWYLFFFLLH